MSELKKMRYPADWVARKQAGQKISMLTAYDAGMARIIADHVDAILVGDSLAMVVQGRKSTLPVTPDEMIYHSRMVRRGAPSSFIIIDMPFASYQADPDSGLRTALRMLKESGADAVKMEGARPDTLRIMEKLNDAGVPVMGHIGLTPQSFLTLGGYRVQGRENRGQKPEDLVDSARALEQAGCFSLVLEYVVKQVSRDITEKISIPTIGIGAGRDTDGQVLVLNDMLGMDASFHAKHARLYANLAETISEAARKYDTEMRAGSFPGDEHSFE